MEIEKNELFHTSKYIQSFKIRDDSYVLWNRLFPSILKVNKKAVDFVAQISQGKVSKNAENQTILETLIKYKIIYKGTLDPYWEELKKMIDNRLLAIKMNFEKFFDEKKDYNKLNITNDRCNLGCSYCVNYYKYSLPILNFSINRISKVIKNCIKQYMERKIANNQKVATISFSGGEILSDWKIIKSTMEWISKNYDIETEYTMNSNLTLMTDEIAQFLSNYNIKLFVSIDGYKEAHDRSRLYKNGKGSFDDVIKGLNIFRKYNRYQVEGFQGTIDNLDEFNPERVYDMGIYGFYEARLAPNLLNTTIADGIRKAELMGTFLDLNLKNSFEVTEVYFETVKKLINMESYDFFLNCKGLSCYPDIEVNLNISNLQLSHICYYVQDAYASYYQLDGNIYNPMLWTKSYGYIMDRIASFLKNCENCEILGICRGGCIYSGLDKKNMINDAACAYQKRLWVCFIKSIYSNT